MIPDRSRVLPWRCHSTSPKPAPSVIGVLVTTGAAVPSARSAAAPAPYIPSRDEAGLIRSPAAAAAGAATESKAAAAATSSVAVPVDKPVCTAEAIFQVSLDEPLFAAASGHCFSLGSTGFIHDLSPPVAVLPDSAALPACKGDGGELTMLQYDTAGRTQPFSPAGSGLARTVPSAHLSVDALVETFRKAVAEPDTKAAFLDKDSFGFVALEPVVFSPRPSASLVVDDLDLDALIGSA